MLNKIAIAVSVLALSAGASGAVTVAGGNGGFEAPVFTGANWQTYAPGGDLNGWAVSGSGTEGGVDHVSSDWWQPSVGSYSVDLNAKDQGGITGELAGLTIGESYTVSFDMSGNPGGTKGIKELITFIDSKRTRSFYFDTTGNTRRAMNWEMKSFKFTATATSQYLGFISAENGVAQGAAIDNVSVALSEVPLPMSALLLLTGLGGLAAFRRRSA